VETPRERGLPRSLELLARPRESAPVRVPRKRLPRRRRVPPPLPGLGEDTEPEERPATPHRELVWKLIQLGKTLGCVVWIASDERGRSYEGESFAEHVLAEFPAVGLDPESRDLVRGIDVLWIRGRSVVAAFEVDATTSVYSGLLRMSDLVALQPNAWKKVYDGFAPIQSEHGVTPTRCCARSRIPPTSSSPTHSTHARLRAPSSQCLS
jgi:hypothetical protein